MTGPSVFIDCLLDKTVFGFDMRFHWVGRGGDCVILIKFSGNFVPDSQKVIY